MEMIIGNTARTNATSKIDSENELRYMVTMNTMKKWSERGLLTAEEFCAIDTKMRQKYRPKIGTLWFDKNLLCS